MPDPAETTRRDFLVASAAAGAAASVATVLPASALGRDGNASPNERITLGVIGIGP